MSKSQPNDLIADLKNLFQHSYIEAQDLQKIMDNLKTKEVKNYVKSLSIKTKPESALRENFFSINSSFANYLFEEVFPEVDVEEGYIDYLIKAGREEIELELKALYVGEFEKRKSGKQFKGLKKTDLSPQAHREQILKYLKGGKEYVVLTNLEQWYFYSRSHSLSKLCPYFESESLFEVLEDYTPVEDFWQYLDKKEDLSLREPLDKRFYNSLKEWVAEFQNISFTCSDKEKTELIIYLLNKFIFIQSLDKFWVIRKNYIEDEWNHIKSRWGNKDKGRFLIKFFEDLNAFFYEVYDTELFIDAKNTNSILEKIEQNEDNSALLFRKLKLILGIDYGTSAESWLLGITQYNFRRIDEDILGRTYETYLAEIRNEQGIFYTRRFITKYIVDSTLEYKFNPLIEDIIEKIENEDFNACRAVLKDFFSIKIIDPACGSGSFLIKALRKLWEYYRLIHKILNIKNKKFTNFSKIKIENSEIKNKLEELIKLRRLLSCDDLRQLISQIILRHIYGADLDEKAINIAKLNLWLEAIKLSPKSFQSDRLPSLSEHILPNLNMNLINGNSLVGWKNSNVVEFLERNNKELIQELFKLRSEYIDTPQNISNIDAILKKKTVLREKLVNKFKEFLKTSSIGNDIYAKTKPLFWSFEFWFSYFSNNPIKSLKEPGFNIIIGNPPWGANLESYDSYIEEYFKEVAKGQYDSYQIFLYHGIKDLLTTEGILGYIIPNELCLEDTTQHLRSFLLEYKLLEINNLGYEMFDEVTRPSLILLIEKEKSPENNKVHIFTGLTPTNKSLLKDDIKTIEQIISDDQFKRNQNEFLTNEKKRFDIFAHPLDREIKKIIEGNNFEPFKTYFINGRGIDTNKSGRHFVCPSCGVLNPPFGVGRAAKNEKACVNSSCDFIFKRDDKDSYSTIELILEENFKEGEHHAPGYIGEDLHRYYFSRQPRLIRYYGDVAKDPAFKEYSFIPWKDHELYEGEKLLFRKVSSGNLPLVMVYLEFLVTNQQIYIFKKKDIIEKVSIYFYHAILTSRLMHYYYLKEFGDPDKEVMPHFTQRKIKSLPVPNPDLNDEKYKTIVQNTKNIIDLVKDFKRIKIESFKDFLTSKPIQFRFTLEEYIEYYSEELNREFYFSKVATEELTNDFSVELINGWLEVYVKNRITGDNYLLFRVKFNNETIQNFLYYLLIDKDLTKEHLRWDNLKKIRIPRFLQNIELNIEQMGEVLNEYFEIITSKNEIKKKIQSKFAEIDEIIFDYYHIAKEAHRKRIIEVANANGFEVF